MQLGRSFFVFKERKEQPPSRRLFETICLIIIHFYSKCSKPRIPVFHNSAWSFKVQPDHTACNSHLTLSKGQWYFRTVSILHTCESIAVTTTVLCEPVRTTNISVQFQQAHNHMEEWKLGALLSGEWSCRIRSLKRFLCIVSGFVINRVNYKIGCFLCTVQLPVCHSWLSLVMEAQLKLSTRFLSEVSSHLMVFATASQWKMHPILFTLWIY